MPDGTVHSWVEYVRRFGDLPVASRTTTPVVFGDQYLVIEGWYGLDDETLHVQINLDNGEGAVETLVREEHATIKRTEYAFDDVRDAIASTLAEGVRAYFRREAAP